MATGRFVKKPNAIDPSPPTTAVAVIISRLIPSVVNFIHNNWDGTISPITHAS